MQPFLFFRTRILKSLVIEHKTQFKKTTIMKVIVLNSISLQLFDLESLIGKTPDELPGLHTIGVQIESPIKPGDEVVSFIGHPDTAAVAGVPVNTEKKMYKPDLFEDFWVYQLICPNGQRLPNGATTLPEGFKCLWVHVRVQPQ